MGLSALDIIVLILVAGGALFGVWRGFVTEVLSLFAWIAAIIAVKILFPPVVLWMTKPVGSPSGAAVLSFALIFGAVFIGGKLIAGALGRRTRQSVLGPIDRLLGLGFGALKGVLLATLLFLTANLATDTLYGEKAQRPAWMRGSRSFLLLNVTSRAIVDFVEMRRKQGGLLGTASENRADPR